MKNRLSTVLLFIALLGVPGCNRKTPNLHGFWEGTIQVKDMKLRVVLKITKTPEGNYAATLDSVDQGAKDLPVSSIVTKGDSFRMELKTPPASYEGNLNKAGTEIVGLWKQGPATTPLTFKRTTEPSKIPTAKPDSAYAQRGKSELHGYWKGTLAVKGIELRLALKIAEEEGGKFTALVDSIDQGSKNLPASFITYSKPAVEIEFRGIGGKFEGEINNEGSEMAGIWTQLGNSTPLVFKRGEPPSPTVESEKTYTHSNENDLQGFWKGALDVQQAKLRLVLKIAKLSDNTFVGTMDSLDQGAKNLPATTVVYDKPSVKLEWKSIGGVYEGKMENGKLTGTWRQSTNSFPLNFERTVESELMK
ncbi:MAG: hypothetical protein ABIR24_14990 [Verrucomicrobiota bacterium]